LPTVILEKSTYVEDGVGEIGEDVLGCDTLEWFEGAQVVEVEEFVTSVRFEHVRDESDLNGCVGRVFFWPCLRLWLRP
jgi:hypothetical protein